MPATRKKTQPWVWAALVCGPIAFALALYAMEAERAARVRAADHERLVLEAKFRDLDRWEAIRPPERGR